MGVRRQGGARVGDWGVAGAILSLAACAGSATRPGPPPMSPAAPAALTPGIVAGPLPAAASSASGPATAPETVAVVPGTGPCESIQDCGACTARPDCRLCVYVRGCMTASAVAAGACLDAALDSPSKCGADPVVLRARERAHEAEQRRRSIVDLTRGMSAAGPPYVSQLDRLGTIEIPVGPGLCHVLVWSLAEGARPAHVRVSLDFVTARSVDGGLTGFDADARVGSTGLVCSTQAGKERFRVVDPSTYAPIPRGGTGGVSFVLFTRPRTAGDPDDVGSRAPPGSPSSPGGSGGAGGDSIDCEFPCESAKTACENDCFRSEAAGSTLRGLCDRTCEQIYRSCIRPCR